MNDYSFGNLLYELRTEKGLSQSELGEMFGVSNKAVSKWEMGVSKPRPAMLIDLASFFQISAEELLAGKRSEKQPDEPVDDSAYEIRFRVDAYRQSRRRKNISLLVLFLIFPLFLTLGIIIIACGMEDSALGPALAGAAVCGEYAAIILFIVFYTSQKRQKRALYALFPERTEEIRQLLTKKKEPSIQVSTSKPSLKKQKSLYGFITFLSIVGFSGNMSRITWNLTGNRLFAIIVIVVSPLTLLSITALIIKCVEKYRSRHHEDN